MRANPTLKLGRKSPRQVKNLRWILTHAERVSGIDVRGKEVTFALDDGGYFSSDFADRSVLLGWLDRSLFQSMPLWIDGVPTEVGSAYHISLFLKDVRGRSRRARSLRKAMDPSVPAPGVRANPKSPRSGLASDFWRAVVSSAFWDTKEVPRQLQEEARRRVEAKQPPLTLEECLSIASSTLDQSLQAVRPHVLGYLATYVRKNFKDAREALHWLVQRDRRLGVWCAAQVARWALAQALESSSKEEEDVIAATERAIFTVERWVRGEATMSEVNASAEAVDATERISNLADRAADAAGAIFNATEETAFYASFYASGDRKKRYVLLRMFVELVGDAILGFPTR